MDALIENTLCSHSVKYDDNTAELERQQIRKKGENKKKKKKGYNFEGYTAVVRCTDNVVQNGCSTNDVIIITIIITTALLYFVGKKKTVGVPTRIHAR